jgi:hypothetical protein
MLETYGPADVGALEEIDASFARAGRNVRHRQTIEGMQSAGVRVGWWKMDGEAS